ncbi:uncharacterized protein LOC110821766, partial [Carica papaya]|uniref:uncharacterized protein LOC110821766 n=1 Tax=Carica papaya TaxID=3649 RepID=UPI000B8CBED5
MDLDWALWVDQLNLITPDSTAEEKEFERWDRSNRMRMLVTEQAILEAFQGTMSDEIITGRDFLHSLEQRFIRSNKVEACTLLSTLVSIRYMGNENIRKHIMEMSHVHAKLKALRVELLEEVIMYFVLISLPPQFNHFKVTYNCQKESWNLNELISHCVQEKERLKFERTESAHLAVISKNKNNKKKQT